jgi:hypothetical protein
MAACAAIVLGPGPANPMSICGSGGASSLAENVIAGIVYESMLDIAWFAMSPPVNSQAGVAFERGMTGVPETACFAGQFLLHAKLQ